MNPPALIVLGGLPGAGKSTVAHEVLSRVPGLAYVRVDTIEHALRQTGELGPRGVVIAGYAVAYALASDLLRGGASVLADSVNPLEVTRRAWRDVAQATGAVLLEIELYCSDPVEHRRRVETREIDIPEFAAPDWRAVRTREYESWDAAHLRIDTAEVSSADAAEAIVSALIAPAAERG